MTGRVQMSAHSSAVVPLKEPSYSESTEVTKTEIKEALFIGAMLTSTGARRNLLERGALADYFTGVAAKRLSEVEVNRVKSNQHEFNGVSKLRSILGTPASSVTFPAKFIYLSDTDDEPIVDDAYLSWYDSRKDQPHRSAEWRLYFPTTTVSERAAPGDVLVIGRRQDDTLLAIVAEAESTIANQILWLFGIGDLVRPGYSVRSELETAQDRLGFASRLILESIGVAVDVVDESRLDHMIDRFGERFPPTREFSAFARDAVGETDVWADPDAVLMAWMEREEILFRTMEKHLVSERLATGFVDDVDGFISYSLSVQNRRKSRVGLALENHLEAIFNGLGIRYSRAPVTEHKAKPDFLFPGITEYRDRSFDPAGLTMLGAKSTCKDRWRQVLSEAKRIERKHLLTLETAISTNQTDEMEANHLQLVVPQALHSTYSADQQFWILNVAEFCHIVENRQFGAS